MSTRNLEAMLNPSSVALIGADQTPGSAGTILAQNLFHSGFSGELFFVNLRGEAIDGAPCYPDVHDLPEGPDLAVVAAPLYSVPTLLEKLGRRGTRAAVIVSTEPFDSSHGEGLELRKALLQVAAPYGLRIVGPQGLGLILPRKKLNASLTHVQPLPGNLAFVAQSDAVQTAVLDWAVSRRIGFSHFLALGTMVDVDFGDLLDYLANESLVRAILLHMEMVTDAREFMSAARAAARMKPVIVLKSGRHVESDHAVAANEGIAIEPDAVYDAAFQRAGMLRVDGLQELFGAVETLGMARPIFGDRLVIVANGSGPGVLATDALWAAGGRLARLSSETLERLRVVFPWVQGNPVDIRSDASAERYAEALRVLLEERESDALMVLNAPNAFTSATDAARAVATAWEARSKSRRSPIMLTNWLGEHTAEAARQMLAEHGLPTYETPTDAVCGFMQMVRYRQNQEMLMETPPSIPSTFAVEPEKVRQVIDRALGEGRSWLSDAETRSVLAAYAIPLAPTFEAGTPQEAARAAMELGGQVTLKIISPDLALESSLCGLALDLETPTGVQRGAEAMAECVQLAHPGARIVGFRVQPLVRRGGYELRIGMGVDVQFGPVLLFGHGGSAAEVIRDQALALPPLNLHLAREMMTRTRLFRLLEGYGDEPPANLHEIALVLVKVSQLICDMADIAALDINPLLADRQGILVQEARIKVSRAGVDAAQRLAIRPYPKELETAIRLPDGSQFLLRPIRPEDEPALQKLFASLTPEEIRMRFLHPMRVLTHSLAARLTQIDYDREMALVLTSLDQAAETELYGSVRISADADKEHAEFAILLRRDFTGMGLGPMLMRRIIDYAGSCGIREIYGDVLHENKPMLKLAKALGFRSKHDPDDPSVVRVTLTC